MMLDMYPKERVQDCAYVPKQNPFDILNWFDSGNYFISWHAKLRNIWLQDGVRPQCFFASQPARSPTLSKIPLVKWKQRFAYLSSNHLLLQWRLNHVLLRTVASRCRGSCFTVNFCTPRRIMPAKKNTGASILKISTCIRIITIVWQETCAYGVKAQRNIRAGLSWTGWAWCQMGLGCNLQCN